MHIADQRIPRTIPKRQLGNSFKLLCRYTVGRPQLLPMTSLASLASVVMPCAGPLLLVLIIHANSDLANGKLAEMNSCKITLAAGQ